MKNKLIGGIMGLAVGDALGVPVEFTEREILKKDPVINMRGFGTYNQPAGTWSDDTSLTLCLLDSLEKGLDYDDILERFVAWYQNGGYTPFEDSFDIGNGTRSSIERYLSGTSALECGGDNDWDNGNGALMRILPVVFYLDKGYGRDRFGDVETMGIIQNVAGLTHRHKKSIIACGIYCGIAHNLLYGMDLKGAIKNGIEKAVSFYGKDESCKEESYAKSLSVYERLMNLEGFAKLDEHEIYSSGYVVDTLEAAVWCLLNSSSYEECVLKAVNLGEDTDTVAAVAGGLAGISYGYESIPARWINEIARKDYILGLCEGFDLS